MSDVVRETPRAERTWRVRSEWPGDESALSARIAELERETGLSPITLRVCLQRGLTDAVAIRSHLHPSLETLTDPFRIQDMEKAVARIAGARAAGEKILVYGDYDVDGTTAAALLTWFFRDLGLNFSATQPDRFKDGYGLNVGAVEAAAADGVRLMVTVDCGITSFDAIARANELGVDLIVVDHHQVDALRGLPAAHAVLNPQRADCPSGLRQLCGCGLAFYFCMAIRAHGRDQGWFGDGQTPNLKQHLDLVVLATAADQVPLTGDNRTLVHHGLKVLQNSKKPGFRALMEAAGISNRTLSPGHLGFVLGPRINASGRIGSASIALETLTTRDSARGIELAQTLERVNAERMEIQNRIWDEVKARVDRGLAEGRFQHAVVVGDPGWHEGVVGIVASRVVDAYHKPAIVIAIREDFGKGSVRSFGGKNVLQALQACAADLRGFGGHKFAAGLTVTPEKLEEFALHFDEVVGALPAERNLTDLMLEGDCGLSDFDSRTLEELESLAPFGPGNPEPVFRVRASVQSKQLLKGRHVKMRLNADSTGTSGKTMEAIWFHSAEQIERVEREAGISEWAGVPELNRFMGRVTPTFRVKAWRPRGPEGNA
ncbi:MAG: single-stranded-DNA-specific exonuclease RecJ [Bacteriovoracia bacterium]